MTRFDFFSKISYIIYKNKDKVQLKKAAQIESKDIFETMFGKLEKSRNFISNPLLESLRRHKFNFKGTHTSITNDNKMEAEKQDLLEKLPIFSIFKNIK